MSRPDWLVLVLGTATAVGKTWSTAHALSAARSAGIRVAARKPVQSFAADDAPERRDAAVLGTASGEAAEVVCPPHRWLPVPMAPPMAWATLGTAGAGIAELVSELSWPDDVDVGVVETVGGVRAPIALDADSVDLIGALRPDHVVLVADAGLGTINAVRLSIGEIRRALADAAIDLEPVVVLNRFDASDDLHRRNRDWLVQIDRVQVRLSTDAWLSAPTWPPAAPR